MGKLGLGMQQILHLLQLNLFERRDLNAQLRGDPPEPRISPLQNRLLLA
jgi:putative transposase